MDTTDQQAVTVAQEDREAAEAVYAGLIVSLGQQGHKAGRLVSVTPDDDALVQAFARHRLASVSSASAEPSVWAKQAPTHIWLHGIGDPIGETTWATDPSPSGDAEEEAHAVAYVRADVAASPEPVPATNQAGEVRTEWRCFHCGDAFTDERCARLHFGRDEDSAPACQIKAGAEQGLLGALRDAEYAAADAMRAIADECTDAAKAYYSQMTRHNQALRNAEELGYERGLADARALAIQPATSQEGEIGQALRTVPSGWSWSIGQMMGLPESRRYRCFLSDHNTPDGKATFHCDHDDASPVAAILGAVEQAHRLRPETPRVPLAATPTPPTLIPVPKTAKDLTAIIEQWLAQDCDWGNWEKALDALCNTGNGKVA